MTALHRSLSNKEHILKSVGLGGECFFVLSLCNLVTD
jgi:hypothetical protein